MHYELKAYGMIESVGALIRSIFETIQSSLRRRVCHVGNLTTVVYKTESPSGNVTPLLGHSCHHLCSVSTFC